MTTSETAGARLERKVDALIESVQEVRSTQSRLADQMASDKRLQDQLNNFVQQAIDRTSSEVITARSDLKSAIEQEVLARDVAVATEKAERDKAIQEIKSSLSKIGFALFTALLGLFCSGLAYLVFSGR